MSCCVITSLVLALAATSAVSAHKYGFGKCANVQPMIDFDADRVVGLWYVHRAFSTSSSCLTFNFTRTADGLKVTESKELRGLDAVGLEHKYSSVGTLTDNGPPGAYEARFSTNPVRSKYIFMNTDYASYAGVFHCQHAGGIVHRRNVYVLSRNPSVSDKDIEQVRRRMLVFDLDPDYLGRVSHDECIPSAESDLNLRLDGTLFDLSDNL